MGSRNDLGVLLLRRGQTAEARAIFESLLAPATAALGADSRNVLKTRFNIAQSWVVESGYEQCLAIVEDLLTDQRAALGPDHIDIVDSLRLAALAEVGLGRAEAALPLFQEAIAIRTRLLGPSNRIMVRYRADYGGALAAAGRHEEAIVEFDAVAGLLERLGDEQGRASALNRAADSLDALGRASEAAERREGIDTDAAATPPSSG